MQNAYISEYSYEERSEHETIIIILINPSIYIYSALRSNHVRLHMATDFTYFQK
jgi:hypothetical protein